MALETGVTYIDDLVNTNPAGASDNIDEGDDHIRNIKTAVQGSFPSLGAEAVTKTAAEINDLVEQTDPVIDGTITGTAFLDEDDMSSDSAVKVASQQSIKAYVDKVIIFTGTVNTAGTTLNSYGGSTSARTALGKFTITHNLGDTNYTVSANASAGGGSFASITNRGNNTVEIWMITHAGAFSDATFDYLITSW